jgi:hypothetical protein
VGHELDPQESWAMEALDSDSALLQASIIEFRTWLYEDDGRRRKKLKDVSRHTELRPNRAGKQNIDIGRNRATRSHTVVTVRY